MSEKIIPFGKVQSQKVKAEASTEVIQSNEPTDAEKIMLLSMHFEQVLNAYANPCQLFDGGKRLRHALQMIESAGFGLTLVKRET